MLCSMHVFTNNTEDFLAKKKVTKYQTVTIHRYPTAFWPPADFYEKSGETPQKM